MRTRISLPVIAWCPARLGSAVALGCLLVLIVAPRAPAGAPTQDRNSPSATRARQRLARRILADGDLQYVLDRAKAVVRSGFNAGDTYGEVWIRDFATFMDLSCQVGDRAAIRKNLLMFFRFQGDDGNIIDGFIPADKANVSYSYIRKTNVPQFVGHKNTVETDQESSLVQAVYRYVNVTGDRAILDTVIDGKTVRTRLEAALDYVRQHRFSEKYGLVWGATTADWGDVQPEHEWGVVLDSNSHKAIDIYDNAMFLIAISNYVALVAKDDPKAADRWRSIHATIRQSVRQYLWDSKNNKFIPHIYLDGSPFPADFDERRVHYHGGTAVAIEAGLLSTDEIRAVLNQMRENVRASGAASIGLTIYPPYPRGFFKNPSMGPYSYQNGGDWTWFGGRMIQTLVEHEFVAQAYRELQPMVRRVRANNGFFEWYNIDNKPQGSGTYRGSAGVLAKAIQLLDAWAHEQLAPAKARRNQ